MQRVLAGKDIELLAKDCLLAKVTFLARVNEDVRLALLLFGLMQFLDFLRLLFYVLLREIYVFNLIFDTLTKIALSLAHLCLFVKKWEYVFNMEATFLGLEQNLEVLFSLHLEFDSFLIFYVLHLFDQ